jgi:hypothetical protein
MGAIHVPPVEDDEMPPPHSDEDFVGGANGHGASAISKSAEPRIGESPASIAERWATAGAVVRVPTGIVALDELHRGGLTVPRRVAVVGAPGAGKTFMLMCVADHMARMDGGPVVGVLGSDEDPDDLCVRLAQMAGYGSSDLDRRDSTTMLSLAGSLARLRLRFYSSSWTIDAAGADVTAWAKAEGRPAALFIDSIQTVTSVAANALERRDSRQLVEANTSAVRALSESHPIIVGYTSEANRSAYRAKAGSDQADIASGNGSSSIEYGAQTVIVLRTPAGHDDVVHAVVPKNRRERRSAEGFYLRLDRERHALSECPEPTAEGDTGADDEQAQAKRRGKVEADARELAKVLGRQTGPLTERGLRAAVTMHGLKWGVPRVDAAKALLVTGLDGLRLVNRGTDRASQWHLESVDGGRDD